MSLPERTDSGTWRRSLSPEEEVEVVARYQGGETMEAIGRDYGVGRVTVRRTLKRHGHSPRRIRWINARRRRTCPGCGEVAYVVASRWAKHCSRTCASRRVRPRPNPRRISNEDLETDLIWIALDIGRVPRARDLRARSRFCYATFQRDGRHLREWHRRVNLYGGSGRPLRPTWREWAVGWLQKRGLMNDNPNGR